MARHTKVVGGWSVASVVGLALGWVIGVRGIATSAGLPVGPGRLEPSRANPLLVRGGAGEFDVAKVGPRVVLKEGPANYKMWYEGVPGANRASVGFATSADGLTWKKFSGNPVMSPSEPWEGGPKGEVSPNTVLREGGTYRMWYHSWDGSHRRIGYATSQDGLHWMKYGGNPVLDVGGSKAWDAFQIAGPTAMRIGSVYYMWYMGLSEQSNRWRIGLATSPDGVTWTKHAANPVLEPGPPGAWDHWGVGTGGIIWDGTRFHLYYPGWNKSYKSGVGYATSLDGIHWTRNGRNPILGPSDAGVPECRTPGDSVTAYRDTDELRILYGGWDGKRWSICMAVSKPIATRALESSGALRVSQAQPRTP